MLNNCSALIEGDVGIPGFQPLNHTRKVSTVLRNRVSEMERNTKKLNKQAITLHPLQYLTLYKKKYLNCFNTMLLLCPLLWSIPSLICYVYWTTVFCFNNDKGGGNGSFLKTISF